MRWLSVYSPVNARSVPALRSTSYSSGVSCSRHSVSVLVTGALGRSFADRMTSQHSEDAEDSDDQARHEADEEQPDDQARRRAPPSAQPDEAAAERGQVLQLAVDGVGVRRASPGAVDVRGGPGRIAGIPVLVES